jgi:hypothetical protein
MMVKVKGTSPSLSLSTEVIPVFILPVLYIHLSPESGTVSHPQAWVQKGFLTSLVLQTHMSSQYQGIWSPLVQQTHMGLRFQRTRSHPTAATDPCEAAVPRNLVPTRTADPYELSIPKDSVSPHCCDRPVWCRSTKGFGPHSYIRPIWALNSKGLSLTPLLQQTRVRLQYQGIWSPLVQQTHMSSQFQRTLSHPTATTDPCEAAVSRKWVSTDSEISELRGEFLFAWWSMFSVECVLYQSGENLTFWGSEQAASSCEMLLILTTPRW